jgi:hypothetical protein
VSVQCARARLISSGGVDLNGKTVYCIVWQTRAHATAFEEDPVYTTFAEQRAALSAAPVLAFFVHMSGNPRRCLESPVTEVDVYKLQDAVAEKTQDMIRDLTYHAVSLSVGGLLALSWGPALEDATRGANIVGWNTIEVRAFFFFFRSGSLFLILSLVAGTYVNGHGRGAFGFRAGERVNIRESSGILHVTCTLQAT